MFQKKFTQLEIFLEIRRKIQYNFCIHLGITMTNQKSITVLDVSKGLGYGLLYHPVIGIKKVSQYPLAVRFPTKRHRKVQKKFHF